MGPSTEERDPGGGGGGGGDLSVPLPAGPQQPQSKRDLRSRLQDSGRPDPSPILQHVHTDEPMMPACHAELDNKLAGQAGPSNKAQARGKTQKQPHLRAAGLTAATGSCICCPEDHETAADVPICKLLPDYLSFICSPGSPGAFCSPTVDQLARQSTEAPAEVIQSDRLRKLLSQLAVLTTGVHHILHIIHIPSSQCQSHWRRTGWAS